MHHSRTPRADRFAPGGSRSKFDGVWDRIRGELNRQNAIAISRPDDDPDAGANGRLPLVSAARVRDQWARYWLGLPQQDYRRRDFAGTLTADQFAAAKRRGRRIGRR